MTARVLAVALTADERALLVSALVVLEELGADRTLTRPIAEMLDAALDLGDQTVREMFTAGQFFTEAVVA